MSDAVAQTKTPLELLYSGLLEFGLELGLRVVLALATIIAGLMLAKLLRRVARNLIDRSGLEALLEKIGVARVLYKLGLTAGAAKLGGQLVYWGALSLTLMLVLEQLNIEGLTKATGMLVAFLPRVLIAASMILLGILCGDYLKGLLLAETQNEPAPEKATDAEKEPTGETEVSPTRRFLAHLLQGSAIVLSATLALEHIGVAVTLIHGVIKVSYLVVTMSVAVAFAIGARHTTKHVAAGYYARKLLREGDILALGDGSQGELKSFKTLHVLLQVDEERELVLPYGDLMSRSFTLVLGEDAKTEENL